MVEEEHTAKVYDSQLVRRLLGYLRPYRGWVVVSVFLLMIHSLLGVSGPYLTKVAIDRYLNPQPQATSLLDPWLPEGALAGLNALALIYLSVLLVGFGTRFLQTFVMHYTGQRVMYDLRRQIFAHLQKMEIAFYDRNPVGRLVTRVTTDVDVLNELFTSGVVAIFGDVLTLAFILAAMIHLSPMLTLVLFAVLPVVLLVTVVFRIKARQSYRQVRTAVAKINAFLQEHFVAMSVVQLFNYEPHSRKQFGHINNEHREAQRRAIRAHAYFFPAIEWLGVLGIVLLLIYGGSRVAAGTLSLGIVVAFLQYGTRIFRPLQDLSEKYNILQSAMASCERIFGLLDTPPREAFEVDAAAPAPGAAEAVPERSGNDLRIEFQQVWFAYQRGDWVLQDVSFTIEPGETLAIVGHTGAGKTTLISLLLRFYEVRRGRILVGGQDIRAWPLQELRRQFGVVLQDPHLFSGTIGENIRLHNPAISEQRVLQVAREVNLDSFVQSLSHGYQEPLGERGASLSWGQMQLISFARALVHQPRVLILDEATSSVDTATELQIREAVPKLMAGHTSIVIAHRLSTIKRADRILVMHKGRVRELGTHRELLQQRGIYWRLYELQYSQQEAGIAAARSAATPRPADVTCVEAEPPRTPALDPPDGASSENGGSIA